MIIYKESSHLS